MVFVSLVSPKWAYIRRFYLQDSDDLHIGEKRYKKAENENKKYGFITSKNITLEKVATILGKNIQFGEHYYSPGSIDNTKMSKSLGNVISPDKILDKYGVDILRLWVVASDYYDDLKLDNSILKAQTDSYRRIRNTFRYLLGNLNDDFQKIMHTLYHHHSWLKHFRILHHKHRRYV